MFLRGVSMKIQCHLRKCLIENLIIDCICIVEVL